MCVFRSTTLKMLSVAVFVMIKCLNLTEFSLCRMVFAAGNSGLIEGHWIGYWAIFQAMRASSNGRNPY